MEAVLKWLFSALSQDGQPHMYCPALSRKPLFLNENLGLTLIYFSAIDFINKS